MTEKSTFTQEATRTVRNLLAPLLPYIEGEDVNEVMINGDGQFFIERGGGITKIDCPLKPLAVEGAIRAIMALNSKSVQRIMDARLPGLRIACALPPVAVHGPMMSIRRHSASKIRLDDYVLSGAFSHTAQNDVAVDGSTALVNSLEPQAARGGEYLANFLRGAVRCKKNILLVGGTGSGKTTMMSSLLAEIGHDERIITCEDTNELSLVQPNVVQFEALDAPGEPVITIRHLIKLCLRCRPDRIIVGEVRGAEAYDLLDAINTGHPGSICTLHADSAVAGLQRLESLVRMSPTATNMPLNDLRRTIAAAIDYVIFLSRRGGVRGPHHVIALNKELLDDRYDWRVIFES